MEMDGTAWSTGLPAELPLPEAFHRLNNRRIDLDRRLTALSPGHPGRDLLWLELEPILAEIRVVVADLAKSSALQMSDVRAKAAVLATLTHPGENGGDAIISDDEKSTLTLSLTDDIARLTSD
jgi:hypothetical protein